MISSSTTAKALGLYACQTCGLVSRPSQEGVSSCGRCGSTLRFRKTSSIERASAYLIAACILYIPANLLPIMETQSILGREESTIASGVAYLWYSGSWPLALVVFVASIAVPVLKLLALAILLATVYYRSAWRPAERTKLYRLVELIGRWSMLDVYVVAILAALVQFHPLATVTPRIGAVYFGAVVVLSMLSALAFDPRLIWDSAQEDIRNHGA
ncbi:MAG TPA: paraquat-inducible protein A [Nitrospira sp.]|nr:paraquat-inducible protein A [Nitrospira sp.]